MKPFLCSTKAIADYRKEQLIGLGYQLVGPNKVSVYNPLLNKVEEAWLLIGFSFRDYKHIGGCWRDIDDLDTELDMEREKKKGKENESISSDFLSVKH